MFIYGGVQYNNMDVQYNYTDHHPRITRRIGLRAVDPLARGNTRNPGRLHMGGSPGPHQPYFFGWTTMPRVTLKDLVEKYDAPEAITVNWFRVGGTCNRTGDKEEGEVYFWLGHLVYMYLSKYENPHHFLLLWDKGVKLEYCKYNNCYTLARFSLSFSCRNAYHSQNFKPLLCILSKLNKVYKCFKSNDEELTFYQLVKQCAEEN